MVTDAGPWRGPTLAQWLRRISPWPIPWVKRDSLRLTESELRYLWGDR